MPSIAAAAAAAGVVVALTTAWIRRSKRQMSTLTLYTNPACPFARRGMIAAKEKGLFSQGLLKTVLIPLSGQLKVAKDNPEDMAPTIAKCWPNMTADELVVLKENYKRDINETGEVPTLVLGDGSIVREADVIAEWMDDAFPAQGVSLMPRDPLQRSKVRHYHKILSNATGVAAMYGVLRNQDPSKDEVVREKMYSGLASFAAMADDDGPYFLGKTFSFADAMLMPMYDQFRYVLPHYRGVQMIPSDIGAFPWAARMQRWAEAVEQRESFTSFSQGEAAYIRGYKSYAGERGISSFGQ